MKSVVHHHHHHPQKKEDWIDNRWRPSMAWLYLTICFCDFILFPILWSVLQSMVHGQVNGQWQPLTLQGAGLLHLAFGAIIGVSAHGRTQEKIAVINGFGMNAGTTYQPPSLGENNGFTNVSTSGATAFGTPTAGNFPTANTGFGTTPTGTNSTGGGGFGSIPTTNIAPAVSINSVEETLSLTITKPKGPPKKPFPER